MVLAIIAGIGFIFNFYMKKGTIYYDKSYNYGEDEDNIFIGLGVVIVSGLIAFWILGGFLVDLICGPGISLGLYFFIKHTVLKKRFNKGLTE